MSGRDDKGLNTMHNSIETGKKRLINIDDGNIHMDSILKMFLGYCFLD